MGSGLSMASCAEVTSRYARVYVKASKKNTTRVRRSGPSLTAGRQVASSAQQAESWRTSLLRVAWNRLRGHVVRARANGTHGLGY
ncbi:hypothetical protein C1I92_16920 [Jiangella anatolica]|uniref:Uncharacterized protein n=1 Tax=Jiangella anatolica TaxID=2670374 RepID=A0A2W2B4U3_9ACTN|nr:hypothetical protein C1I92_16920 [Jiangella anatolica]